MPFLSPRTDWNLHISSPEAPAGAYTLKYSAPSILPITTLYVISPYILFLCDTSPYIISQRFNVPVIFIPEVWDHIQG